MSVDPIDVPVLLTARPAHGEAKPLSTGEFWALMQLVGAPQRLLELDEPGLGAVTGYPEGECSRIRALLARGPELTEARQRYGESGIRLVSCYDEAYPTRVIERLGSAAPPLLYVAGEVGLLAADGLGVVGSRNVSREAMQVAEDAGRHAAEQGVAVVSGAARGVDQIAMGGALDAGGSAVGFPADSLERMVAKPEVAGSVEQGCLCLATPYTPSAGFTVGAAMGRNKLIYAMSSVTLVVASDDGSGGTWAGATEALKKRMAPVAVWDGPGAGPGNAKLVRMGAAPLQSVQDVLASGRGGQEDSGDEQLRMIF
ncbi:MAG: DNA-processing protein DprA [Actinomycetota bacterium]